MGQQSSATTEIGFIATRTVNTSGIQHPSLSSRKRSPNWAKRIISGVALTGLSLNLLASGKAEAVSFTFEKIVDTDTPVPGSSVTFREFGLSAPSLDNGDVVFEGGFISEDGGFSEEGIYTSIGGKLDVVVDTNTPIPGGIDTFSSLFSASLDNGNVAFSGDFRSEDGAFSKEGIYTNIGGKLNVVVDTNTPIPGGIANFSSLGSASLDDENVAFSGGERTSFEDIILGVGIYTNIDGALNGIVNTNTPVPNFPEEDFDFTQFVQLDNENVVFDGGFLGSLDTFVTGIYTNIDGGLNIVADTNTPTPGGTGNFVSVGEPSLDNGNVAFQGISSNFEQSGIYTSFDGKLNIVADTNTPVPGGTGTFDYVGSPLLDNGNVAFVGSFIGSQGNVIEGIYTNIGGDLAKVIAEGDLLDGKKVRGLSLGSEGLSGNQIAFSADFKNIGSQGIYIATVPEPSSALGTLAFGVLSAGWVLKRRQRKQQSGLDTQCLLQSRR